MDFGFPFWIWILDFGLDSFSLLSVENPRPSGRTLFISYITISFVGVCHHNWSAFPAPQKFGSVCDRQMPSFVPVVDVEKPRDERDDDDENFRKHRKFDAMSQPSKLPDGYNKKNKRGLAATPALKNEENKRMQTTPPVCVQPFGARLLPVYLADRRSQNWKNKRKY